MRDEDGLYDPRPIEDERPDPAAAATGYRIRSDATWALARDAYLGGETAQGVCDRFDLSLGAFRERARNGGWRRCDHPDPDPLPVDASDDVDPDAGYAELADHALRQLRRAMALGRASAAASWMRLHERLLARAEAEAGDAREVARRAEVAQRPASPALQAFRDQMAAGNVPTNAALAVLAERLRPHDPDDPHPVFAGPAPAPP